MQKHILIIGQGPSHDGVGKKALDGEKSNGSGNKLSWLASTPLEKIFQVADVVNLLDDFHGKNGKGDKFPLKLASEKAKAIYPDWSKYEWVILLGSNVARAFHFESEPLVWQKMEDCYVSIVPHPSGVNRFYNKEENRLAVERFLFEVFHEAGDGKTRSERALHCTKILEDFERQFDWVQLAAALVECERDKLYLEVGQKSWEEWVSMYAPKSQRLCYLVKARYKVFESALTLEEMRKMPPETAEWASKAKNISPGALKRPEVRKALSLPKKKAIEALKEAAPDQHIEETKNRLLKFSTSQHEAIVEAFSAYKVFVDEKTSLEDFIEYLAAYWFDSSGEENGSFRERYHAISDAHKTQEEKAQSAIAAV